MKKFGLIGKTLKYSYSKIIHEYLIKKYNINASYDLIEMDDLNLEILNKYNGLNITIPFKQDVIKYLTSFENDFNACNTIINNSELVGYNTDIIGFDYLVKKININQINSIVVLGSGATNEMVKAYFKNKEVITISRSDKIYNYDYLNNLKADLLINTTPVGMSEFKSPIRSELLDNYQGVIDLNYNPINSKLSLDCKLKNIRFTNGLDMLIVQACAAFEIWHNLKVTKDIYREIEMEVYQHFYSKIALIGMPLSGKSTMIKKYNGYDLDDCIVESSKQEIKELIAQGTFRDEETNTLKNLVLNNTPLIALGGGAILKHENMEILKDYLLIYLEVDFNILKNRLKTSYRPLLKSEDDLKQTYNIRVDIYNKYANIKMDNYMLDEFLARIG